MPLVTNAEPEYDNINGIIYNEATGEKVDDVYIKNFQLNDNKVNFVIEGKQSIKLSAEFTENITLDNNSVKVYRNNNKKHNISFIVTDNFITGAVKINETPLLEKFNPNYDEFVVAINLDNTIDFDYDLYLNELKIDSSEILQKNKEAAASLENKDNTTNLKQESTLMQESQISTTSTSSAYVRASAGSVVAEATALYRYVGGNNYNINKITWITTTGALDVSYISVWTSPNASSALWYSNHHGPNNRTNVSTVSLTVPSHGGALIAQVQKPGFVKIYKVPVPYFVSDYDYWYF